LIEPARLSVAQERALQEARGVEEPLAIAAVTLWEIARLVAHSRLRFDDPIEVALDGIERHPALAVLPLGARVAVESTRLGDRMSMDPADHLIVATARVYGLTLVTADERIRRAGVVPVV
jgi:PIN domain nuclease of toxin-antitoxin system